MKMRTVLFITVLAGAAVAAWVPMPLPYFPSQYFAKQASSLTPDASSFRTASVERGDVTTIVQAAGTLNALVVVDVGSQISGLVTEVNVDFNSPVVAGEVIARVDPDTYEARLAQAEAELEMATTLVEVQSAEVDRAVADLERALARHSGARADLVQAQVALKGAEQQRERIRPLAEKRIVGAGEWDRTQNDYDSAVARLTAAKSTEVSEDAEVRAASYSLDTAEAQLAHFRAQEKQRRTLLRQARISLDRTYIRAPVTGVVVNRAVSPGQTVAASLQSPVLFTIAQDLRKMQVEASIVEADIGRFVDGQPVAFNVDAYPGKVFHGTVRQIRKAPQFVQNVVTYVVIIDAENEDELLLPGMTANLQVVVARRENVLTVPNVALRFRPRDAGGEQGQRQVVAQSRVSGDDAGEGEPGRVFVLGASGQPELVPLRLGITDGKRTEVLQGSLDEGDRVIIGFESPSETGEESSLLVRFRLR